MMAVWINYFFAIDGKAQREPQRPRRHQKQGKKTCQAYSHAAAMHVAVVRVDVIPAVAIQAAVMHQL